MSYHKADGVAYIHGQPAAKCTQTDCFHILLDLSDDLCPVCHSHLAKEGFCLNACHLTSGQRARFKLTMGHI